MKNLFGFAVGVTAWTLGSTVLGADITGTVTLKGTPPPEKEIVEIAKDANCGPLRKDVPKTRFFVVSDKNGLADVVVSVKGAPAKGGGDSAPSIEIDQLGCEYVPYIAAVQTKQKIVVKNSDPVLHNVHTTPTVKGNTEQNKAQLPKGPDLSFSFDMPEEFLRFKCDVHPWMFAYVTVFDHPYFAVSGKDGDYKISNVPPGKYTIEAKHRKGGTVTKEIEVKDGENKLDLEIEVK